MEAREEEETLNNLRVAGSSPTPLDPVVVSLSMANDTRCCQWSIDRKTIKEAPDAMALQSVALVCEWVNVRNIKKRYIIAVHLP